MSDKSAAAVAAMAKSMALKGGGAEKDEPMGGLSL